MLGATLSVALGATLLAVFRLSGSPASGAHGLVWISVWLIAIGCGLQLGAILDRTPMPGIWAVIVKAVAWTVLLAGTAWAVYLAPGGILFVALLVVPPLVGMVGLLLAAKRQRPAGLTFLAVALGQSAVHLPAAIERLG